MMKNRIFVSVKQLLTLAALPLLTLLSPQTSAGNIPEAQGPCGILTSMGDHTKIYNNSRYAWNVVFKTTINPPEYGDDHMNVNAAAVKYLSDGIWIDNGTGDYRREKTYTVPVSAGETVKIAYCADSSMGNHIVIGKVSIIWNYTAASNYPDNGHGQPGGNVEFRALNSTPIFLNHGTTPYVNYNKNLDTVFENGSLTLCPNDPECKIP